MARFENYRGFLFGSLNPDVQSLEDYLGATRVIIDQIVDQAPEGLEVLRGNSSYVYDGNWKLQMENGADGYHVSAVHWNYSATTGRRKEEATKAVDADGWSKSVGGVYGFDNGHILLWTNGSSTLRFAPYTHTARSWRSDWARSVPSRSSIRRATSASTPMCI